MPTSLSPSAAAESLERLWEHGRSCEGGLAGDARIKTHLLYRWAAELVRIPEVLDAVEAFLGPDILVWSSAWAVKPPHTAGFFSWHQDSTYAGLVPDDDVVVAWLALTESRSANGCVRYIPGSHARQLPHADTFEHDNLLSRGQQVSPDDIDELSAEDASLAAGECAFHHFRCVHGSNPNTTGESRVGLQIIYMPTCCKSKAGIGRQSASLVRGVDTYGHWGLEPMPSSNCAGESEIAAHRRAMALESEVYFNDSEGRRFYHR